MAEDALRPLHTDARAIFTRALAACRIERIVPERVRMEGSALVVAASPEGPVRIDLARARRLLIIALGKAAVPMTECLLAILPSHLAIGGICCGPSLPVSADARIHSYAGGHPLPNQGSFHAARHALDLLAQADAETAVLFLISGGGSTLFELPLDPAISLEDTIAFHRALVGSGATIAEINTLRKHFSAVKGGRLAAAAPAAQQLTLQLLDVPWSHAEVVASGPTLPDRSSVADCRSLLERYRLLLHFPASVRAFFEQADLPETPKPGDRDHPRATMLSNDDLLHAAQAVAEELGYLVAIDNSCDDWPWDRAAAYLVDRLFRLHRDHPGRRVCLLSGGEVTVAIDRPAGIGGRNQHFALACALLLDRQRPGRPVAALSAGSDGVDGNSPAAGAVADATTASRARAAGIDPEKALAAFDSHPLFAALGDSVVTGATRNNLRDLRVLLIG